MIISNKNRELAGKVKAYCLQKGCSAVRVSFYSGTDTGIEVRNNQVDSLVQSTENQLMIFLFKDGKYGSFSTNRLSVPELKAFVDGAINSVQYLSVDECRKLPSSDLYYHGGAPSLEMYDSNIEKVTTEKKIQVAMNAASEIEGKDNRIISIQSAYGDGMSLIYMTDSNGFEGEKVSSYYSLSVSVSVHGEGDARPESYWFSQSLSFDELVKEGIAKTALRNVLAKIGQHKIKSGKYKMLVMNKCMQNLVYPLISALDGTSLQQNNSFLLNKKGEKVLSEKITITDNPHRKHSLGAKYFNGEGVATKVRKVFDRGVLKTYFVDVYNAAKMNAEPTIDACSRLEFDLGARGCKEIASFLDNTIIITDFNGGNSNGASGDFSFGIEGFLVEKGKITRSVSEMNITGNLIQLWNNVEEVGNDPLPFSSNIMPSILFSDVDFSGE